MKDRRIKVEAIRPHDRPAFEINTFEEAGILEVLKNRPFILSTDELEFLDEAVSESDAQHMRPGDLNCLYIWDSIVCFHGNGSIVPIGRPASARSHASSSSA